MARQVRGQASKENSRWRLITYSIIVTASGLLIWSSILLDKTFIQTGVVLLFGVLGGLFGTALLTVFWRKHRFPFWVILFYGMLSGSSLPVFFLAASNYYLRESKSYQEQVEIVSTGNYSGRKSACKKPYAVVIYNGIEKELSFDCEYEKNISNFKTVTLILCEGLFGFDVIENKELVPYLE